MARSTTPMFDDFSLVTVKHHEGSTIFSFEGESSRPWEELAPIIKDLIDRVQKEVDRQDGIVGHVKAFVEDEGAGCAFTATGYEIHTKPAKERISKVSFAAIIFIREEAPIVEMMEAALSSL